MAFRISVITSSLISVIVVFSRGLPWTSVTKLRWLLDFRMICNKMVPFKIVVLFLGEKRLTNFH